MKNIKYITFFLACITFILSIKYLYNSYTSTSANPENFLNNIILVFSNIMLVLVFLFLGKSYVITNSNKIDELKRAKLIIFILLIYIVFSFSVLMNFTLSSGLFEGEYLFNQISSILLSILLIGYFIYRLKEINNGINNVA